MTRHRNGNDGGDGNSDSSGGFRSGRRVASWACAALAGLLLLALAACGTGERTPGPGVDLGPLASGSFSGGSIGRGSVIGTFAGRGVGNTEKQPYFVSMTVEGVQWFECRNNGGNYARGQFAYTGQETVSLDGFVDENGRFVDLTVRVAPRAPTNADCKRNWSVIEDSSGDPVTFFQVKRVVAVLLEDTRETDRLAWDCADPAPTAPLTAYTPPPLTGPGGVCTLTDGPG